MSGRGERPEEDDSDEQATEIVESVALGGKIYNREGGYLGSVRGHEKGGFFVTTRKGVERLSIEHARSGHDFGEAHLMWRCMECGEMGKIGDGLPERCPNCGTKKEDLMWWTED